MCLNYLLQLQLRSRSIESRYDRYMLLTFDEPPANIKVLQTRQQQEN